MARRQQAEPWGPIPPLPLCSLCLRECISSLDEVKKIAPPERLLVLSLEQGFGWDEICGFLGQPVPNEPYPRINSMSDFHVLAEMIVGPSVKKTWIGLTSSAIAVASVGVWYFRRR